MLVRSLRLRDFRNLVAVDVEPDPRFNVVVGRNGQGKTNLIEAIYFLAALKSFRSLTNANLIREGSPSAICSAWVDRAGSRREVEVTIGPRGRSVNLNGERVRKLGEFFGVVNTVAFVPEDVSVMRRSPGDRRSFFDRMVFNSQPAYASEMAEYETALKQRNALLKEADARDKTLLEIYDDQLVDRGARVIERRRDYLGRLLPRFISTFEEIFGRDYSPELALQLRFLEKNPEHDTILAEGPALREALADALKGSLSKDLLRGFTTVGPHRDDFRARLLGHPMKEFASQGQHRAFVLALKITEIQLLNEQQGHHPILLLDDVSSELDTLRSARLFDFLSTIEGQVFITTTDVEYIRLSERYRRFDVVDGEVST